MSGRTPWWPREAGPVVAFAAITATALLAAPAIAAQLAEQWRLSPAAIGLYFTVEQGGMCLATLPAIWWLTRVSWRRAAVVAATVFVVANLASTQAGSLVWLLPLRAVSALAGGSLMVLSMTIAARAPASERLFGLWVLGQIVVGAFLLYALPRLFAASGLWVLYLILAVLMAAVLPLVLGTLPERIAVQRSETPAERLPRWTVVTAIAAVLLHYVAYGGVWPFMMRIATEGGGDAVASGGVLAVATLFGFGGASLATALARRRGQGVIAAGYLGLIIGIALLLRDPAGPCFAVGAFLMKGGANFTVPFLLGRVASLDRDGRLMSATNMAIGGGLAIGPLAAGLIIQFGGGLAAMIGAAVATMLASGALILWLRAPSAHLKEATA
jgi:predicted MFS family arabinose efflux permease